MKQRLALVAAATLVSLGCKESPAPPPPAVQTPAPQAVVNTPPQPAQATGPRAEVSDPRFTLVFALASGASASDPARFTVELRGQGGYHVNDQYPVAIDVTYENAASAKTALRRADASEMTRAAARFDIPVQRTGEHPGVRGQMRFSVCTDAQCAIETRPFAVTL